MLTLLVASWPRAAQAEPKAQSAPSGGGAYGLHVVAPGESMFSLAQRYGMRPPELAHLNARSAGSVILPGQRLWIPLEQGLNARADEPALPAGSGSPGVTTNNANLGPDLYTVQAGDTLFGIATRFRVDVEALKAWNGLPLDGSIQAGAVLLLKPPTEKQSERSDEDTESAGAVPVIDAQGRPAFEHTVSAGETLTSIALRYGERTESLRRLNDLAGDAIYVGQRLKIPSSGIGLDAAPADGAKRIDVDVSEQRMYVWQGDTLVWNFVASTGISGYPTKRGNFAVQSKIPNAWSSAWQLWMPYWLGIYWAGPSENGIHALPIINGQRLWAGLLGSPVSYGCVVLGSADAERLYNWAEIGTPVTIRD